MTKKGEDKKGNGTSKSPNTNSKPANTSRAKSSKRSAKKDVPHVVHENNGWVVRSSRTGRFVTAVYPQKSDAIDAGRRIARNSSSKVLVHGRSGQIFQRSPVPSTVSESVIRRAVRMTNEKSLTKSTVQKYPLSKSGAKSPSKKK